MPDLFGMRDKISARFGIGHNSRKGAGNGSASSSSDFNMVPKMPAVTDPEKPRIDVTPADLVDAPTPPSISDKRLYDFVVTDCFRKARDARLPWERDWKLSVEFFAGNQWVGYDEKARKFQNALTIDPDPQRFSTTNLIKPRIESVAAMVTQSAPVSICVPLTTAAVDQQAAVEGRGVLAHYNRKFGAKSQMRDWVDWSLISTTAFLKSTFEPGLSVEEPEYDDDGEVIGVKTAPRGDIVEQIVPGFRVFGDPTTTDIDRWRWLIHAEVYPLSWFASRFENGNDVTADPGGTAATFDNLHGINGISPTYGLGALGMGSSDAMVNRDVATCYEMWILPGVLQTFPQGALIYCAGGRVLTPRKELLENAWGRHDIGTSEEETGRVRNRIPGNYLPWPYDCKDEFPFIGLSFGDNPDSAYGTSLVQDMIEPQMDYNRTRTRIRERLEKDKPVIIRHQLDGGGADKFEDMGLYCEIRLKAGSTAPQYFAPPPVSTDQYKMLEIIEHNMDDISGIHDPNFRGALPANVTSGVAINALKSGDSSRMSKFAARIEHCAGRRDMWRLRHAAQFFATARLMGMDDTGNPSTSVSISSTPVTGYGQKKSVSSTSVSVSHPMPSPATAPVPSPMVQVPPQGVAMPPPGMPQGTPQEMPQGPPATGRPSPGQDGDSDADDNAPDGDPTANPAANVQAFKALTSGGQCRIMVEPGSALAQTPDAKNAEILDFYKEGMYGPPGSPPAARIAVKLMSKAGSDIILQELNAMEAKQDALAAASMPPPPPPPVDPVQMAQLQAQSQLALQNAKAQSDLQLLQARLQAETQQKLALAEQQYTLQKQHGPLVSLAGKLDPAALVAAEEAAGLDVHGAAAHLATVAGIAPDVHHAYGVGTVPSQVAPPPDPAQQAQLQQQTAEHAAGVDVQKAQAMQALQPPPADPNSQSE